MKPKISITLWLYAIVVVIGFIALWIAAFFAFSKVATPFQAFFSSALIEISAIVEAIALVRNWSPVAFIGLLVSIAVSGTYNYIQASINGQLHGITNWWQLGTLAFGPLIALTFITMTLGIGIREYEKQMFQWEQHQEIGRREESHHQDSLELQREQMRLDSEAKIAIEQAAIQAENDRKLQIAQLRLERKQLTFTGESPVKVSERVNESLFTSEGKRERIWEYIESVFRSENRLPGPTEIMKSTGFSIGYAHRVLSEFKAALDREQTVD